MAVTIGTREAVAAVVTWLDAIDGVAAHLSVGASPPAPRTVVVHPLPGRPEGSLGNPDDRVAVEFQTTSIGATGEQALWTHDKVAARLTRAVVTWTGYKTLPIWPVYGSQQPVRRDDDLAVPLFYVTCSWVASIQPA